MTEAAAPPYVTLTAGRFGAGAVVTEWIAQPYPGAPEWQRAIERAWETLDPNPHFNGRIARLERWRTRADSLHLTLRPTDYKTLLFSNGHAEEIIGRWGKEALSRALGISAVVCSADEQIILMQRSARVGEYPGYYDVFGGHIDVSAGEEPADPFRSMAAELSEELALEEGGYQLTCMGLLQTRLTHKPELLFVARCAEESTSIIRSAVSAKDRFEYTRLLCIGNAADSLADFLGAEGERTSPSAFGALEIYSRTFLSS